ncbi:class I SAM-dependent methyltransferase [Flexivirga meconopsidis]|uniref:class I SAM-dependent methyltransferase n=1 Tax=Flexivirga meconopsidis TaxID=2977121 RepID=UPI0022407189|nr:class I SAM-dependent methyltransferase [Flexivirga meconopsidis]
MPQPRRELAATFQHAGVAAAYRGRPPYPDEAIELLTDLVERPARVLDIGAGEGSLARPLAPRVDEIVAVELYDAMVSAGRTLPGGDAANLHWVVEPVETFTDTGTFGLAVAGASLHWFDLLTLHRRLADLLAPGAVLAVCDRWARSPQISAGLAEIVPRYSRAPEYDASYSATGDLAARGLWQQHGSRTTKPVPFRQSVSDFIEGLHSTSTLARELMTGDEADAFDTDVHRIADPLVDDDGLLTLQLTSSVVWGELSGIS